MFGLRNLFQNSQTFSMFNFFVQSISKTFINIYFKKLFKWYIGYMVSVQWIYLSLLLFIIIAFGLGSYLRNYQIQDH